MKRTAAIIIVLLLSLTSCGSYEIDNDNYSVPYKAYSSYATTEKTSKSSSKVTDKSVDKTGESTGKTSVENTNEKDNSEDRLKDNKIILINTDKNKVSVTAKTEITLTETASTEPGTTQLAPLGDSETAYITNYGKKYHRKNCGYLYKSATPIKVSLAKEKGYSSCSKCKS